MKVAIYFPPSPGCTNSAHIVAATIAPVLRERRGTIQLIAARPDISREKWATDPTSNMEFDCAFFMERVTDHPALMNARHRILIPNPEWLDPQSQALAVNCTHVWHKSRFSFARLGPLFPLAAHTYLGFTTQDPGHLVANYGSFIHLRGKIETQRNTDTIFRFWKSTSGLPDLYVHFYWQKTGGIDYPGWLSDGNVHVRMGWMDRTEYLNLAKLHGIHLCTSEVEGFGHYINEARAMGSLVITTDGAPMNELIDDTSGILVRPASTSKQNWGVKYGITPEDLAPAIERILSLSPKARHDLGTAARERFLTEDRWFRQRALDLFSALR